MRESAEIAVLLLPKIIRQGISQNTDSKFDSDKNSRPVQAAEESFQSPGVRGHIPQIRGRKVFKCAVPGQIIVKGRIEAQRKWLSGQALPKLGKDKLYGGFVRMRNFLFHSYHLGDSLPEQVQDY